MIPSGAMALAFSNSVPMARILAPMGSFKKSGSRNPICAVEIIPIPPAFATAPAREERLMPTPIPPCMTGYFAIKSPITNGLIFLTPVSPFYIY